MSGRVLNFTEFSDKYSNVSNEPVSVDDITKASSNFEEGFDDETYDQPQIGPNRPVAGNYEMTPATPGSDDAPAFSAENTEEMNAPEETAPEESTEHEAEESPSEEEAEHAEGGSEEGEADEESSDDEEDEHEEGNPEAGANPKKKVDEGITLVKGFAQFINEDHGDYPKYFMDDDSEDDEHGDHEECPVCGEEPIRNEYGVSCGCNM
jgi:type IV secretory pathway VirB10-like protein